MPDNPGERRECLVILEKVDWTQGLLDDLVSDREVRLNTGASSLEADSITY